LVGTGAHFTDASLYIRKAGATAPVDYLIYKFKLVLVSQMKWAAANGDDSPQETVTFQYGALQVNYTPQTATGGPGRTVTQTWNQVTNTSTFDIPGI